MSNFVELSRQLKTCIQQSRLNEAVVTATDLLNTHLTPKEKVETLYLKAVAQRLNGNYATALEDLKQLLTLDNDHARAYQEQGYIYKSLQDIPKATSGFYQATVRNPALLSSWQALKSLYAQMANSQATDIAIQQIQYLERLPKQLLGALDLFYESSLYQAEQVCRQYLQQHKHHPDGMILLARIGIELKIYSDAEFLLESCVELYPDNLSARLEYTNLLIKIGKFNKAIKQSEYLLSKSPQNPAFLSIHASGLVGVGDIDNALVLYHQLLNENEEQPGLHLLLGHAQKAKGHYSQAIAAYKNAFKSRPSFGDAYWSLANTKTYQFENTEIFAMEEQIASGNLGTEDQIHMLFALGKACEDQQDYDKAFSYYQQGNALKHEQTGYDADTTDLHASAQIDYCTPCLFDTQGNSGCLSPEPIFIVGLPRAGSTLLEQILASHSQIDGTMELPNILSMVARLKGKNTDYPRILHELDPTYLRMFGEKYLEETKAYRGNAPFFIDKMPNNFMHIGLIKLILPNAKIIDARRDPIACCFSGYKQLFAEGQEFTYDLHAIGRYYQAYLKVMEHWNAVLPGQILKVQHEEVIEDLQGQVERILTFCELPFEQACIDFHKTERNIKTPSSEQVRQPIYRSGMEQWKHFERHLEPLTSLFTEM